jgi:hypothetical protein
MHPKLVLAGSVKQQKKFCTVGGTCEKKEIIVPLKECKEALLKWLLQPKTRFRCFLWLLMCSVRPGPPVLLLFSPCPGRISAAAASVVSLSFHSIFLLSL